MPHAPTVSSWWAVSRKGVSSPCAATTIVYESVNTSSQQTYLTKGYKVCLMSWPYGLTPCRLVDDYRRNAGIYVASSWQTSIRKKFSIQTLTKTCKTKVKIGWRERNQQDATNLMFIIKLLSQPVSGIIMSIIRRTRVCTAACGVLHWFWWLWLCGAGTRAVCTVKVTVRTVT